MRVMKGQWVLFNGISVAACLAWIGIKLFAGFGRALGNTSGSSPNALAPLALIVRGQVVMPCLEDAHHQQRERERAVQRAAGQKKLSGIPKDYVYQDGMGGAPGDSKSSFLTLDRTLHTLVRIDVSDQLETLERPADLAKFILRYVDAKPCQLQKYG